MVWCGSQKHMYKEDIYLQKIGLHAQNNVKFIKHNSLIPPPHLTLAKPKSGSLKTKHSHHRHYLVPSLVGK